MTVIGWRGMAGDYKYAYAHHPRANQKPAVVKSLGTWDRRGLYGISAPLSASERNTSAIGHTPEGPATAR